MPDDFIGMDVYGIPELQRKLRHWPVDAQNAAVDATNKYLLDVLKQYPPYVHVAYKDAYGGWFSDKQRKYVMAKIREGSIRPGQPNRSQDMAKGWKVIDKGVSSMIVNELPYAGFLMGTDTQARMPKKIGWKTVGSIVKDKIKEIERKSIAAIRKVLAKKL